METDRKLSAVLRWLDKHSAPEGLRADPDEGRWEIVRIETVRDDPAEREHIAYGFRCSYNDLIVGGLCELSVARMIARHKLAGSYVEYELWRQSF